MRIVVPVKQVPETGDVRLDEKTGTMLREGVESIVNPLDLYAIETALRIRDERGGEVIALSMGPPAAAEALREAMAMGCDRGFLLSHKQFAGADTLATAYVLALAIQKIGGVDLVVCGERATDGDTGQVGPGMAASLGLPVATFVSRIEAVDGQSVRVERLVEGGRERLEMSLPALLTVVKEIGTPRLPTLAGKRRASRSDVAIWGPEEIGAENGRIGLSGSPTRVVRIFRPKVSRQGRTLNAKDTDSAVRALDELMGFLESRNLI